MGKHDANLKSSLKKPRITEEDEGFIDTNSDPPTAKKAVQFKTQIDEIPTLEITGNKALPSLKMVGNGDIDGGSPRKSRDSRDRSPSKRSYHR